MTSEIRVCTRCVMDETDEAITFDEHGICNHCRDFSRRTEGIWFPGDEGRRRLEALTRRIQAEGKGKNYDCILGLSGGLDSSYLAIKLFEMGYRPLVVHVDGGWNTELAVKNIEKIVSHCGWHLHTHVIDWREMRDLQLAYLRSGISNQDVPQDHAFFGSLYHFAVKNGIRYVMSGGNIATESVVPPRWHWSAMDSTNLKAIHRTYGTIPLKSYPTISFFQMDVEYPFVRKMRNIRPLNLMPYVKADALVELQEKIGYKRYDRKHGESVFTKFFQNHWLPEKYGYDKRKLHFSSMILSGQMTRDEAVAALAEPLYDPRELERDKQYVAKKLGISDDEFEQVLAVPKHSYRDFPNMERQYSLMKAVQRFAAGSLKLRIKNYS